MVRHFVTVYGLNVTEYVHSCVPLLLHVSRGQCTGLVQASLCLMCATAYVSHVLHCMCVS